MFFKAKYSTADGRLTKGKIYQGGFVYKKSNTKVGLRIVVFDDKRDFMTFDPRAFVPSSESFSENGIKL